MKNKLDAYLTVEAVLVMPIVIAGILLVMYLWFFQYDRCLLEIDTNAVALRVSNAEAEDNDERMFLLKKYMNEIYYDKYAAWNQNAANIKIEKGSIYVEQEGNVIFPFESLGFWNCDNIWSLKLKVKANIINPVFVVRNICKLKGGY